MYQLKCKTVMSNGASFLFTVTLKEAPKSYETLEAALDEEAKIVMAENGADRELGAEYEYSYVVYERVEGEANILRSGSMYAFEDETQNEGSLPMGTLEEAKQALEAYALTL